MIHLVHPFDHTERKNLGREYNRAFQNCPDGDWLCLMDWDVMFLTHDALHIMHNYIEKYPNTGMFTCWTNRLHAGAKDQLWNGKVNEDTEIKNHIRIAENIKNANDLFNNEVTEINHHISGMLMLISKSTWQQIPFNEDKKCLGVDNEYSDRILQAGKKILRMNKIYIFHLYRLMQGVKDKSHLL